MIVNLLFEGKFNLQFEEKSSCFEHCKCITNKTSLKIYSTARTYEQLLSSFVQFLLQNLIMFKVM